MKPVAPSWLSWKTLFLLCLPALIAGAVWRIWLLHALPEAWYGPDGGSYFHTATRLWTEGKFSMMEKRRWLYPALLCLLPPLPGSPIQAVAVLQHLAGWLLLLPMTMIVARCTRFPKIWVPLASLILACWPQSLWFEHSLEAETLLTAAFAAVVLAALPAGGGWSARRLFWFLLLAALVMACKPHGRGIWLGCLLVAAVQYGYPWRWPRRCWAAGALGLIVLFTSGSSGQGNWLLLNSVLPYVPLEGKSWSSERQALRPLLEEARTVRERYAWEAMNFKYRLNSEAPETVSPKWAALVRDGKKFNRCCRALAWEGIRAEPLAFAKLTGQKIAISLAANGFENRVNPARFWKEQAEENRLRWKKRVPEVSLLYGMKAAEYEQLVAERRTRKFAGREWLRAVAARWGWFAEVPAERPTSVSLRWTGWLSLAGALCSLRPAVRRQHLVLWLPALLYAGTVFAVGDRLGRYAYPLNWLGVVFVFIALDAGASLAWTWCRERRKPLRHDLAAAAENP